LTALKSSLYDPEYIKGLIDTYFLKNQHKVTFIMTPDQNYNSMLEVDEQARLDTMSKTLTTEDREIIKKDALALLKLQDQIEGSNNPSKYLHVRFIVLANIDTGRYHKDYPDIQSRSTYNPRHKNPTTYHCNKRHILLFYCKGHCCDSSTSSALPSALFCGFA
jgi:Zn-dependent M16 (insulinase) family peptidase